jgi:hypothetical protein
VQYANLSDWLVVDYLTQSGNDFPFNAFGVYAGLAPATQPQLASLDVPIASTNAAVGASSFLTINPIHIQPGDAQMTLSPLTADWFVNVFNYDYGTNAVILNTQIHSAWAGKGGVFDIPMLDTPYQIDLHAGVTAVPNYNFSWMSK